MRIPLFQLRQWIKANNVLFDEREEARKKAKAQKVHVRRVR